LTQLIARAVHSYHSFLYNINSSDFL